MIAADIMQHQREQGDATEFGFPDLDKAIAQSMYDLDQLSVYKTSSMTGGIYLIIIPIKTSNQLEGLLVIRSR